MLLMLSSFMSPNKHFVHGFELSANSFLTSTFRGRCQLAAERGRPSASVFAGVACASLEDAVVSVNPSFWSGTSWFVSNLFSFVLPWCRAMLSCECIFPQEVSTHIADLPHPSVQLAFRFPCTHRFFGCVWPRWHSYCQLRFRI